MSSRDTIFLINDAGELEQVPHRLFSSEDLFQTLIEKYPELLVGEQIDPDNPPRWLLIQREAGIPGHGGLSSTFPLSYKWGDYRGITGLRHWTMKWGSWQDMLNERQRARWKFTEPINRMMWSMPGGMNSNGSTTF